MKQIKCDGIIRRSKRRCKNIALDQGFITIEYGNNPRYLTGIFTHTRGVDNHIEYVVIVRVEGNNDKIDIVGEFYKTLDLESAKECLDNLNEDLMDSNIYWIVPRCEND